MGLNGNVVFMTDNGKYEWTALAEIYPNAILLLYIFHISQAHWCYLWTNENGVQKAISFQCSSLNAMVYASSIENLDV